MTMNRFNSSDFSRSIRLGNIMFWIVPRGRWNDVAGTSLQHTICEHNINSDQGTGSKNLVRSL